MTIDKRRQYITAPRDLAAAHCRAASVIENRCGELTESDPQQGDDHGAMYISSAILRAFSIELGLKSLLFAESQSLQNGHNLKTLFEKLSVDSQAEITAIAEMKLPRSFCEVISEIATVFEDWRYIHERFGRNECLGFDTCEFKVIAHAVLKVLDGHIRRTVG